MAGTGGHLAPIVGGHRRARYGAEHHAFGAGPGMWQRDLTEAAATVLLHWLASSSGKGGGDADRAGLRSGWRGIGHHRQQKQR